MFSKGGMLLVVESLEDGPDTANTAREPGMQMNFHGRILVQAALWGKDVDKAEKQRQGAIRSTQCEFPDMIIFDP